MVREPVRLIKAQCIYDTPSSYTAINVLQDTSPNIQPLRNKRVIYRKGLFKFRLLRGFRVSSVSGLACGGEIYAPTGLAFARVVLSVRKTE